MNLQNAIGQIYTSEDKKKHGVILKIYLENFKRLNNVFGYEYCDKLLKLIITYLEEITGFHVYRHVGVEFFIILEQYTSSNANRIAEEITERFDSVWKIDATDCMCSVQIGMCAYPGYARDMPDMLKCLDLALTKASDIGPNQYLIYDSVLKQEYDRKQTIAHYLQTALEQNEIEVRFRPTCNMEKNCFTRAEFYMRIFIQGLGMIGAGDFLPVAEDSGQIRQLEYYALEQVGKYIAALLEDEIEFESIALPISPVLFLQEDFLLKVEEIIKKYKLPPKKLAIEVPESIFVTAYLNVNVIMQELSDMGVELILNDFGSGYSGITTILDLPIDTVKLERLFIWQLETNLASTHVIDGLIQIARHLGLNVIAEGVETKNQLNFLNEAGCTYQQGFYHSPTVETHILKQILGLSPEQSNSVLAKAK